MGPPLSGLLIGANLARPSASIRAEVPWGRAAALRGDIRRILRIDGATSARAANLMGEVRIYPPIVIRKLRQGPFCDRSPDKNVRASGNPRVNFRVNVRAKLLGRQTRKTGRTPSPPPARPQSLFTAIPLDRPTYVFSSRPKPNVTFHNPAIHRGLANWTYRSPSLSRLRPL